MFGLFRRELDVLLAFAEREVCVLDGDRKFLKYDKYVVFDVEDEEKFIT